MKEALMHARELIEEEEADSDMANDEREHAGNGTDQPRRVRHHILGPGGHSGALPLPCSRMQGPVQAGAGERRGKRGSQRAGWRERAVWGGGPP